MVFKADISTIGEPNFNVIDIDVIEVAKALQLYLVRGSKLTGVSLDDVRTSVVKLPENLEKPTLVDLLSVGMKLFDALIWITAGYPRSHPLRIDNMMKKDTIPSMHEIARSLFYVYFFLLTQARYPASANDKESPKVPNFLKVVMGMTEDQHVYTERICSFPPQKFDPGWVRHVHFKDFGQEVMSRFGLGVAGYRLFGPFKLYPIRPDLPDNLRNAAIFAKSVAESRTTWDIHPLTRNIEILNSRGNLNKNLGNLILDVFTQKQIDEMVANKILFKLPEKNATALNYLAWSPVNDISGEDYVFPRRD